MTVQKITELQKLSITKQQKEFIEQKERDQLKEDYLIKLLEGV